MVRSSHSRHFNLQSSGRSTASVAWHSNACPIAGAILRDDEGGPSNHEVMHRYLKQLPCVRCAMLIVL